MQMDAKNAYRMKLKLKISLKTEKSGMERLRFRETAVLQFENPVGVAPRGAEVMFHRDDGEVMFLMNVADQFINFLSPFWIGPEEGSSRIRRAGDEMRARER